MELVQGQQTLVFSDLPVSLENNSLHLEGEGEVGIKILNLEVERLFLSTPFQEEIKQLEEQINGVAHQIAQLEENIKILLIKEKLQ